MSRHYLEEDVALVQKYFPGAKAVTLRTPFDLTRREARLTRLLADSFQDSDGPEPGSWRGAVWTH